MKGKIILLSLCALTILSLMACGDNSRELYKASITVAVDNESDLENLSKYFKGGFTQKKSDIVFKNDPNAKIYVTTFYLSKKEAVTLIRGISSDGKFAIQDVEITNMFGVAFDYRSILKSIMGN